MEEISSDKAPKAIGPYSQAIASGSLIFVSGQIPLNENGEHIGDGIKKQTRRVLLNIQEILASKNLSLKNVVKTTVYLTDLSEFGGMNEVYEELFDGHKPARATVQVAALPKNSRIEVDVIAVIE